MAEERILVEATIHLWRLPVGRRVYVDPAQPYIASLLAEGYLIRVWEPEPVTDSEEHPSR